MIYTPLIISLTISIKVVAYWLAFLIIRNAVIIIIDILVVLDSIIIIIIIFRIWNSIAVIIIVLFIRNTYMCGKGSCTTSYLPIIIQPIDGFPFILIFYQSSTKIVSNKVHRC